MSATPENPKLMTAIKDGKCATCDGPTTRGDSIYFGGKGLAWHPECWKPPVRIELVPAVETTLDTLALKPEDEALAALARLYAKVIDDGDSTAALNQFGSKLTTILLALRGGPGASEGEAA